MTDNQLIALLLGAMQKFCDRVDAGEVRSKKTYAEFKELLAAAEARESGQEKLTEAVIAQMDNAFHLGQVMHEYASKSSARAMQKAEETDATFRQSRDKVRALLAKGDV